MKVFKNIGHVLYRIWFYIVVGLAIVLLLPFLFISILKESWYPFFFRLARIWSKFILMGMMLKPKIKRHYRMKKGKSYMLIANHTSMIDIMLMLYLSKNPFVFVGKKELAKLPLFGFFYKRTNILVDRSDAKSRHDVFRQAQAKLDQGLSVCIFPEGGVPDEKVVLDDFKDGAFRLAIEHQIPILPMTFHDNKKRFSYTFLSGGPGLMRVTIHKPIPTKGMELDDKRKLRERCYELILKSLQ